MNETTSDEALLAVRLLDGSPDGLLLVDAAGRIVVANRPAGALFGFADGELVGHHVDRLVPDEHRVRHESHRAAYADDPRPRPMGTDLRLFAQHRSGEMFPVEISLSPISVGGETQTVVTIRDVSERQVARAKLLLHEDRERIARDLHDVVIQRLFAAGMSLQSVTDLIDSPVARDRVVAVTDELDETIRAVRSAIFAVTDRAGFDTVSGHIEQVVRERSRHLGFTPDLLVTGPIDDIDDFVVEQLIATLTEALANVANHAAASDVTVRVIRGEATVGLVVRDNGRGISRAPKPLGGLSNLMWRAAELGGRCSIEPFEPSGTELVWEIPY